MALYIPHSVFHLARILYVRPENPGPHYVYAVQQDTQSSLLIEFIHQVC